MSHGVVCWLGWRQSSSGILQGRRLHMWLRGGLAGLRYVRPRRLRILRRVAKHHSDDVLLVPQRRPRRRCWLSWRRSRRSGYRARARRLPARRPPPTLRSCRPFLVGWVRAHVVQWLYKDTLELCRCRLVLWAANRCPLSPAACALTPIGSCPLHASLNPLPTYASRHLLTR